ncbi:hypothetical protein PL11201_340023 [Planktothrix sp. PCC 11201]|nr:hypothetical protein PL11201_340023 [Planktothrix sp. PCC 11201]
MLGVGANGIGKNIKLNSFMIIISYRYSQNSTQQKTPRGSPEGLGVNLSD